MEDEHRDRVWLFEIDDGASSNLHQVLLSDQGAVPGGHGL